MQKEHHPYLHKNTLRTPMSHIKTHSNHHQSSESANDDECIAQRHSRMGMSAVLLTRMMKTIRCRLMENDSKYLFPYMYRICMVNLVAKPKRAN